jgi:DNA-binding transcriptional LysR family regulator
MDDLTNLAIFSNVVKFKSFSKAAEAMGVAKSTMSKRLLALESRLGVQLLHRTTRQVELTDVGRVYYEKVQQIIEAAKEAEMAVSQHQALPVGKLKISAPMTFGQLFLGTIIGHYLKLYPQVEVEVILNDRMVHVIDEGYDVALRVGQLSDSSLLVQKLLTTRRIVVGSPSYFKKHGHPKQPSDLNQHTCLLYSYQREGEHWNFGTREGKTQSVRVRGRMLTNNGDLLAAAAREGLGLAMLPDFIVGSDLERGMLVQALPTFCQDWTPVQAVYPASSFVPVKLRTFLAILKEHLIPLYKERVASYE